jgi:hypothetical protein
MIVVFMCGGKGEVFQNITKLGRKKKLINIVINNPAKFGLTSRTAKHMSLPLSCTVIAHSLLSTRVLYIKRNTVMCMSHLQIYNDTVISQVQAAVESQLSELTVTDKTH